MVDRFAFEATAEHVLLSRWLAAVVRLFQPEIAALVRTRDETVMGWRRRRRTNVFEDPRLEIASSVPIDLEVRLNQAESTHDVSSFQPQPIPPRLPRMAEGWG